MGEGNRDKQPVSLLRASLNGLLYAVVGVVGLATLAATWGGFNGWHPASTIYGSYEPGWASAVTLGAFITIFWGPYVALAGFIVGVVRAHQ